MESGLSLRSLIERISFNFF